jgi:hypothetical protein
MADFVACRTVLTTPPNAAAAGVDIKVTVELGIPDTRQYIRNREIH